MHVDADFFDTEVDFDRYRRRSLSPEALETLRLLVDDNLHVVTANGCFFDYVDWFDYEKMEHLSGGAFRKHLKSDAKCYRALHNSGYLGMFNPYKLEKKLLKIADEREVEVPNAVGGQRNIFPRACTIYGVTDAGRQYLEANRHLLATSSDVELSDRTPSLRLP